MKKRSFTHERPVLVAGHRRPDTDSVVSAVVYAQLLQSLDRKTKYQSVSLGDFSPQTEWLFEKAGIQLPPIVPDLNIKVGDVARRAIQTVPIEAPLGDAIRLITEFQLSLVPVVSGSGKLEGILSDRLPMGHYFYHFNLENFLGVLFQLDDLVRGLGLKCWKPAARPADGCLSLTPENIRGGDILLCTDDIESITQAREHNAAAVIICSPKRVKCSFAEYQKDSGMGIYQFRGSLLSLTSKLSLAIPVRNLMAREFPQLSPEQSLAEVKDLVSHKPYALPVVGPGGELVGVLSRTELINAPKQKIILVDHFEQNHAARGIEEAQILEIVDHHRVGSLETVDPIRVDCRPLGSTATIIACKFQESKVRVTKGQAILLLGAMLADTLLLTSPTTTDIDRKLAKILAAKAEVELQEFGLEVLLRNDETLSKTALELVNKDLKEFSSGKIRFGVAQVETVDRTRLLPEKINEFACALKLKRQQTDWDFVALMITDSLRGESLVLLDDSQQHRRRHILGEDGQAVLWEGCVSRKKQLLPIILNKLERSQT
ncbi:MAG: Inorganic diphosphatase [Verrucomicrobiales bacterium]|nr:Inorganic diphosphatase [Verrucomicrobiales bacterium]MDB6131740.1 Inorganic diphosphatase [Verrucomicrobiales bacterium]